MFLSSFLCTRTVSCAGLLFMHVTVPYVLVVFLMDLVWFGCTCLGCYELEEFLRYLSCFLGTYSVYPVLVEVLM